MFFKKSERRNDKKGGMIAKAPSDNFFSKFKQSKSSRKRQYLLVAFFLFVGGVAGSVSAFETAYREKIFPGISVGEHALGGKTKNEAVASLQETAAEILRRGAMFEFENTSVQLPLGSDENGSIADFDISGLVEKIFSVGRTGGVVRNIGSQTQTLLTTPNFLPDFKIDEDALQTALEKNFSKFVTPAEDAHFQFDTNGNIQGVSTGKSGTNFDYAATVQNLKEQLEHFEPLRPVTLFLVSEKPAITAQDLERKKNTADAILAKAPLTIVFEDKKWSIEKPTLASWIVPNTNENGVIFSISKKAFFAFLSPLKKEIESEPRDAVFEITDGKITTFEPNTDGRKINSEETFRRFSEIIFNDAPVIPVELAVDTEKPKRMLAETNDLGIKEIVGQGTTSFRGSPPNRRKNIARGAALLQWRMIAPDEEFSLLNALAPFTLENGYLSELVIKGNKTTPEVGGGLCQIGTTMFRLILNAGLPVLERRNHSYRVSYYEPPIGMDATIYDPSPDFKFKNDTGHTLLLATNIEGDNLTFTFWGTKDGRKAGATNPVMYDVIAPPPEKRIETLDLKPGVVKCTELAHAGSKAYFTYTVEYPNGNKIEETFHSVYRPWQKVCLVGVEKLSEPPPAEATPSTAENPVSPSTETLVPPPAETPAT